MHRIHIPFLDTDPLDILFLFFLICFKTFKVKMERGHYAIGWKCIEGPEGPVRLPELSFAMESTVIPYYVISVNVADSA